MMNNKRKKIIINRLVSAVFGVLLAVAVIFSGFKLYGIFGATKTIADTKHDEAAIPVAAISDTMTQESASEASEQPDDPVNVYEAVEENANAKYVSSLTLHEKLCQMLIVTPDSITGTGYTTGGDTATKAALEKYPVGGLVHFTHGIISGEQIALFNSNVQSYAKTPMFISVDEEGGDVSRLRFALGAHSVGAMLAYEKNGEDGAFANAKTLSAALKNYGFNTDFAPVADVWSNPANTVIGNRAYSRDFDNAAKLVAAAVRGFNESNIVCSVKHFPGHGDTREDSHDGTAYVHKTLDELRADEFKPFISGIAAGADMVMVGHLIVPAIDDAPATLSKKLVTDILRDELGYTGVVITDSLAMGAVASKYSTEHVAVEAVKAGIDILLMPTDIEKTIDALTAAVASGEIAESRIDESVMRIIELKSSRGIITL